MDKTYNHKETEEKIYEKWESEGCFKPEANSEGKPYCIILPPPNANAPLHMGHAMYVVEDILIRYHRMLGDSTLYLPGTDHAGIETQYVYEKKLAKEGKSRFDFDRETLYEQIRLYVEENRGVAKKQLKRLGFSLDWSREKYTMDPKILSTVFETFRKLYDDKLIYRDEKIISYCTFCGTGFSDLEVNHVERDDFIYTLDYGTIKIATTRPETIFADVAVAVNSEDKRFKDLIGKEAVVPIINKTIPIIADEAVDTEFGTGGLKVTPAHDPTDFEIGQRHNLPKISVIGLDGRMINVPQDLLGLFPKQARKKTIELLKEQGKLLEEKPLLHSVGVCYRCGNVIEPLLIPQWFVKIGPLAKPAMEVVEKGKLKIIPTRFKKTYLDWMKNLRDWNISRQIVWGPRIPAWYCLDCNPDISLTFLDEEKRLVKGYYKDLLGQFNFEEIKNGLQVLHAPIKSEYSIENGQCPKCKGNHTLQETDTFDTWFSSGQWPLTTLGYPDSSDFKKFYPTSVLDTMWDILPFWVARMIMFGMYLAKNVPFEVAHMHSRVVDIKHQKMSKSKGNVIDPIEMVDKYGADALRFALIYGASPASDVAITEDKIRAMRNFSNKLWNIGRFIEFQKEKVKEGIEPSGDFDFLLKEAKDKNDIDMIKKTKEISENVTKMLEKYDFNHSSQVIYEFAWHEFADVYIEDVKNRIDEKSYLVLISLYLVILKLLNPIMPFVTEQINSQLYKNNQMLIISRWPI